ncbi:SDR family NAD(P)-dependent oxidoreductase [Mycobacterium yunnanensis]|uniref:SDR family NAD(P)-dependent oxidoreductase n=2 Tax=Mycobacterium yunnanensis TaxID=368477 RepID=A0A9X2Z612_9MYCO|nr:SDR family NAD(P)-dependent oxidoreductase [Mycobacterium yunnanensis]
MQQRHSFTSSVVIVSDGGTDAGRRLARRKLADGHRVVVVARHACDAVEVLHGHSADQVMAIAADVSDARQWSRLVDRVTERFGRVDAVVTAQESRAWYVRRTKRGCAA